MAFSNADQHIKHQIPQADNIPSILSNLQKYANLTAVETQNTLAWEKEPLVVNRLYSATQCIRVFS